MYGTVLKDLDMHDQLFFIKKQFPQQKRKIFLPILVVLMMTEELLHFLGIIMFCLIFIFQTEELELMELRC
jgi:hypothetical protein